MKITGIATGGEGHGRQAADTAALVSGTKFDKIYFAPMDEEAQNVAEQVRRNNNLDPRSVDTRVSLGATGLSRQIEGASFDGHDIMGSTKTQTARENLVHQLGDPRRQGTALVIGSKAAMAALEGVMHSDDPSEQAAAAESWANNPSAFSGAHDFRNAATAFTRIDGQRQSALGVAPIEAEVEAAFSEAFAPGDLAAFEGTTMTEDISSSRAEELQIAGEMLDGSGAGAMTDQANFVPPSIA